MKPGAFCTDRADEYREMAAKVLRRKDSGQAYNLGFGQFDDFWLSRFRDFPAVLEDQDPEIVSLALCFMAAIKECP